MMVLLLCVLHIPCNVLLKAYISISAIIITGKNIASGKKLQRLLRNTNGGRPDNGVSVCEGVYSKP